jgi:hypothetical protein
MANAGGELKKAAGHWPAAWTKRDGVESLSLGLGYLNTPAKLLMSKHQARTKEE